MNQTDHIRYLNRAEINIARWDNCIGSSANELIYGYSIYLDHMATHWDALVFNDYEAIMPLTWKMKWGIKYLYQPPLTPQLGIFSPGPVQKNMVREFLGSVPQDFRLAEVFLNYANPLDGLKAHDNFILDLRPQYKNLADQYKSDLVKNLRKAQRNNLVYGDYNDLHIALRLHQQEYGSRTTHVKDADYTRFEQLATLLMTRGSALLRSVKSREGELLALSLLFITEQRIYLVESTTLKKGRDLQANHFLLDSIIREFCEQELILDFVGSDIPGIAHFYRNFGSQNQPYFFYYLNLLPWPLRLLK
ncbi:MAG: GNAT family N-acetyltransferase [Chitinophagales bacterium]